MKAIDHVSDQHILSLGRFIVGCARVKASTQWRKHFARCVRNNSYQPYVLLEDNRHLQEMIARHKEGRIIGLKTGDIMVAANQVARAWGQPPLVLEVAQTSEQSSESRASAAPPM